MQTKTRSENTQKSVTYYLNGSLDRIMRLRVTFLRSPCLEEVIKKTGEKRRNKDKY